MCTMIDFKTVERPHKYITSKNCYYHYTNRKTVNRYSILFLNIIVAKISCH